MRLHLPFRLILCSRATKPVLRLWLIQPAYGISPAVTFQLLTLLGYLHPCIRFIPEDNPHEQAKRLQ